MKFVRDRMDAYQRTEADYVVFLPKTWVWTWRIGLTLMVFDTALFIQTGETGMLELGVLLAFGGLVGPFLLEMLKAWAILLWPSGDGGEEGDSA